jgi:putative flippase GtrA
MRSNGLLAQLSRFGIVGIVITVLSAISYWLLAAQVGIQPNAALLLVFAVFSVAGFYAHRRFSFEAAGSTGRDGIVRYVIVNGIGLALNQGCIWLLVERLGAVWQAVRAVTGDDAYERYLERHWRCETHAVTPPLDRKAFHERELRRRWSGLRRCC